MLFVFDLDNTLIWSEWDEVSDITGDTFIIICDEPFRKNAKYTVYIRPGCLDLLHSMILKGNKIGIYSCSSISYITSIINEFKSRLKLVKDEIFLIPCDEENGKKTLKEVCRLTNTNDIFIIDDNEDNYSHDDNQNVYYIAPWYGPHSNSEENISMTELEIP